MARLEIRTTKHTPMRVVYRFLSGRALDGEPRTDGGYLRPGRRVLHPSGHASAWAMLPGWKRQAWRLGTPIAACGIGTAYTTHPDLTTATAATLGTAYLLRLGVHGRKAWKMRRFNRMYIDPTLAALSGALGAAPVQLHVSPELGDLVPRLTRPMSPAEKAVRAWYGEHVEPVMRWLPEHTMRALWALQRTARPVTSKIDLFKVPREEQPPRIEVSTAVPYLTAEQRQYVSVVIGAKIPVANLVESWNQVGAQVTATWTVRKRPPTHVGYADLDARFEGLPEWEFFLGLGSGNKPVVVSLKDDSPHIACSAGSGAGKSTFAQLVAVQVLARGGRVVILDRKGSHRWAKGLAGVEYCTLPAQMHKALVRLGEISDERNTMAFDQPEDWDPGCRYLVIAEELNATFAQLRDVWTDMRRPDQPKTSPAIRAFRNLLFMGRSAKINLFAVAQMLTANTTGGPESRENFGIRALARFTKNNWMMLAPEAAAPKPSRTLGRWQIVVGGTATECQVAYLSAAEARVFVHKRMPVSPREQSPLMAPDQEMSPGHRSSGDIINQPHDPLSETITLRESCDRGIAPWTFDATKKRLQRARKNNDPHTPVPVGKDGQADLYRVGDLVVWIESELVP